MNLIDLLLLLIVFFSVWSGWRSGFVLGAFGLIGWIGSLLLGFFGYKYVAILLDKYFSLGDWTLPVAFILALIIARILFSIVINSILRVTPLQVHRNILNKALGVIPGFINGIITAILVAAILLAIPLWDGLSAQTKQSTLANKLAVKAEWLDEKISPVFDKAVGQTLNKLTIHPESEKSVELPYTVANPQVRPDLEAEMLNLVNEERKKAGLKPLQADPELKMVARAHSKDMFARGYFSHISPEGKTPSQRLRAAGIGFLVAGENLALGQTLTICHNGLMNSPGHRANILDGSYGRVGIGVLDGGKHGLMISQEFRN